MISNWLESELNLVVTEITRLAGDASFRQYFRIKTPDSSFILMDAPPDKECCQSFIEIDKLFCDNYLHAPHIFEQNLEKGWLLLEDFGDDVLLNILTPQNVDEYYHKAIDMICDIQHIDPPEELPTFDETLLKKELSLFQEWFIERLLRLSLNMDEQRVLDSFFDQLIAGIVIQAYRLTHRDFHSRNLICLHDGSLGVLDFQDAVIGPMGYDLISLIKDAYIAWPRAKQEAWVAYYFNQAIVYGLLRKQTFETFLRETELVGLQRHIKVVGIFSRLYQRDGKSDYLKDIPRVLSYINDTLSYLCSSLKDNADMLAFQQLMDEKIIPSWEQQRQ